jgi:isoleucyl-tRNA synthetase
MYYILDAFTKMIAPILAHTAEEAWHTIENKTQDVESVHLASIAKVVEAVDYKAEENKWQVIMQTRDAVLQKLETLRQEKIIASNQEASLTIKTSDAPLLKALNELGADQFAALCIVSQVSIEEKEGDTEISAEKCSYQKCQRCWNYLPSVGQNTANPDLCQRCSEVISTG